MLKVESYDAQNNYHLCVDGKGKRWNLDLSTDSGLPEGETNESIVGKTISVSYIYPYFFFARGIVIEDEKAKE